MSSATVTGTQETLEEPAPKSVSCAQGGSDSVFALGLCYIATPCLIFLSSFVEPLIGLPLAAILIWLVYRLVAQETWRWSPRSYLPAAAGAAILVMIVGIPTGHSAWDWIKHWALINEIANRDWPVTVELRGKEMFLRFYFAAYLVPALIHKTIPSIPVSASTTAWFFVGYMLVLRMISIPVPGRSLLKVAAFILLVLLLGGADALVENFVRTVSGSPLPAKVGVHYENWPQIMAVPLQFASGLTNLAWVPHQSVAVFIAAAMMTLDRGEKSLGRLILLYGFVALWSPYGMIGLLPLMLYRCVPAWRQALTISVTSSIAAAGMLTLVVASYLATELPEAGLCATCLPHRSDETIPFIIFLCVELLAFCILLRKQIVKDPCCVVAVMTLIAIPPFHGQTIDFVARGSMGPLFVLALRAAQAMLSANASWRGGVPVALALSLSLPTTLSELIYHATNGATQRMVDSQKAPGERWASTFSIRSTVGAEEFFDICGWQYMPQYFSHSRPMMIRMK